MLFLCCVLCFYFFDLTDCVWCVLFYCFNFALFERTIKMIRWCLGRVQSPLSGKISNFYVGSGAVWWMFLLCYLPRQRNANDACAAVGLSGKWVYYRYLGLQKKKSMRQQYIRKKQSAWSLWVTEAASTMNDNQCPTWPDLSCPKVGPWRDAPDLSLLGLT